MECSEELVRFSGNPSTRAAAGLGGDSQAAVDRWGGLDITVNNAGGPPAGTAMGAEEEAWAQAIQMSLLFFARMSREAVPHMRKRGGGRIINISGLQAFKGRAGWAHVSASKMGALGLTRELSAELAEHGILVNHIVPGAYDTTQAHAQSTQATRTNEQRAAGIPVGRLGYPEELAKTCAFLASDDASFITGQTIHVNGGALAY